MGLFDDLFDLNRDGETDPWEMGLAFAMLDHALTAEKSERSDILEDAGLDPADYDF